MATTSTTSHRPEHDQRPEAAAEEKREITEIPGETDADRQERARRDEAQVRATAEAAGKDLPRQGDAAHRLSGADVAAHGEKMVKYLFTQPVTITLPGYKMVHFPAGIQDVPESLAQQYAEDLKANRAVPSR